MDNDAIRKRKIDTVTSFGMPTMDYENVYKFGCTMFDSGYILSTEKNKEEIEKLKTIISGKTFYDESEVLKQQIEVLEEHIEDVTKDYKNAIKILRLTYSDEDISILFNLNNIKQ